jgi:hypothetical protein
LIAVGKLAQPLPTSAVTDTTILVNLDMLSWFGYITNRKLRISPNFQTTLMDLSTK